MGEFDEPMNFFAKFKNILLASLIKESTPAWFSIRARITYLLGRFAQRGVSYLPYYDWAIWSRSDS
jgi:hypothetical protein